MAALSRLGSFVKANELLAPYTHLKLGGPADWFAVPKSLDELAQVVQAAARDRLQLRVLGQGCNILIGDAGVRGVVLRLSEAAFTTIAVMERRVIVGAGATVTALVGESTRHGLAGLETLVGIHGTVGGAIRCNANNRSGEIGQYIRRIELMEPNGQRRMMERDEIHLGYPSDGGDDSVLIGAEFELDRDDPVSLVRRLRKAWILRKANGPLSFQAAARIFRNPRGLNAAALIEQAGLARTKVGNVEVSERDAASFIVHPGGTVQDVLRLIDLVRTRVQEKFQVEMELEITLW